MKQVAGLDTPAHLLSTTRCARRPSTAYPLPAISEASAQKLLNSGKGKETTSDRFTSHPETANHNPGQNSECLSRKALYKSHPFPTPPGLFREKSCAKLKRQVQTTGKSEAPAQQHSNTKT